MFNSPTRAEEETVARHRIVGARARQNQPVVAAEGRDHDRDGHDGRARAGKDHVGGFRRDAVARRVLNRLERQRRQIRDVGEQIEADDKDGAERERERNVATRIYHFAGREGDVVPGVGGEKRIRLRHADADEETEGGRGGQALADILQIAAQAPEVAEVRCARARLQTDDDAEHDQRDQRAGLRCREDVLDELAKLQAARVHERQQRDHGQPDELRGRE